MTRSRPNLFGKKTLAQATVTAVGVSWSSPQHHLAWAGSRWSPVRTLPLARQWRSVTAPHTRREETSAAPLPLRRFPAVSAVSGIAGCDQRRGTSGRRLRCRAVCGPHGQSMSAELAWAKQASRSTAGREGWRGTSRAIHVGRAPRAVSRGAPGAQRGRSERSRSEIGADQRRARKAEGAEDVK